MAAEKEVIDLGSEMEKKRSLEEKSKSVTILRCSCQKEGDVRDSSDHLFLCRNCGQALGLQISSVEEDKHLADKIEEESIGPVTAGQILDR